MKKIIPSKDIRKILKNIINDNPKVGDKVYIIPVHFDTKNCDFEYAYLGEIISVSKSTVIIEFINKRNILTKITFNLTHTNQDLNFALVKKLFNFKINKILNL